MKKRDRQLLERMYRNDFDTFFDLFMFCSDWQVKKNAKGLRINISILKEFLIEKEGLILQ